MNAKPRLRSATESKLAALVDEVLSPDRLEAVAHAEDWPEPPTRQSASLPRELWDRALGDIARDILSRPSRQFRARLTELAWRLSGARGEAPRHLTAIVEIIHAGSLIVDDIEDGSTERRGAPCVHVTHGLPRALNGGNWMYFWALQLVERLEPATPLVRDRLHRALIDAMASCHLGQALDLSISVGRLSRAEVYRTVATSTMLKTGSLMELAARMGAIVGGAPAAREEALARFGRRLGLGLQMLDDFGNLTAGSEGNAAKALEDLRNGTPSWPWALASRAVDDATFAELQQDVRALEGTENSGGHARALAAKLRIAVGRQGRREATRYLESALEDLRAEVGARPELGLIAAELQRLETSYGS
jgi:geranylgeranyl pyrophosphate synthase